MSSKIYQEKLNTKRDSSQAFLRVYREEERDQAHVLNTRVHSMKSLLLFRIHCLSSSLSQCLLSYTQVGLPHVVCYYYSWLYSSPCFQGHGCLHHVQSTVDSGSVALCSKQFITCVIVINVMVWGPPLQIYT